MNWQDITEFPDIFQLNNGQEFEDGTPVTPDIFNWIVNALIYLYYREETK